MQMLQYNSVTIDLVRFTCVKLAKVIEQCEEVYKAASSADKMDEKQRAEKQEVIALCEAAQDVAPAVMSSKPLPWPEFVARVVLLQSK